MTREEYKYIYQRPNLEKQEQIILSSFALLLWRKAAAPLVVSQWEHKHGGDCVTSIP